jgi:hypothetical protein
VGHSRRDTNEKAMSGYLPFLELSGLRLPPKDAGAVEGVKPFPAAGMDVIPPHLTGGDGH